MNITDVDVKLVPPDKTRYDRLRAFCDVTIDDEFVVHDLRIIDGNGGLFVAMPARKITDHCDHCGTTNHLRAIYCNHCGLALPGGRRDQTVRAYADVAHPLNSQCRSAISRAVLDAYWLQVDLEQGDPTGRRP